MLAELTLAPVEVNGPHRETGALHHDAAALGAVRALGRMAGNVADVNVVQAFGVADGFGALEGGHGGRREVLEKILGMELREVQGNVGS